MRLLLNTHTLLWFYGGDKSLPEPYRIYLQSSERVLYQYRQFVGDNEKS